MKTARPKTSKRRATGVRKKATSQARKSQESVQHFRAELRRKKRRKPSASLPRQPQSLNVSLLASKEVSYLVIATQGGGLANLGGPVREDEKPRILEMELEFSQPANNQMFARGLVSHVDSILHPGTKLKYRNGRPI